MRNVNSHSTRKVSENRNIKKLWIFYFAWSSNSYNFQNIEYSKGMSFLHISREAEIHTVPKRWDELIPKLQNKYGKHRQIPGPVLPCSFRVDENSPMSGNVQNSYNMEIFCEKLYRSQAVGFWRNLRFFPISWRINENTHIFLTHGFGEIFPVNPWNSQNKGKVNSHSKEKMGKHKHSKVKSFLNILRETGTYTITKRRDEWTPIFRNYNDSQGIWD